MPFYSAPSCLRLTGGLVVSALTIAENSRGTSRSLDQGHCVVRVFV